ncbi:MAG: hypothetical protein IT366_12330 [Candidatus Hydrogenedentes bacterium]|nr:hypothetical protein [Candidatus Hydrogenedentota bacterium]
MQNDHTHADNAQVPWWPTVICASLAGGMGWGIRGQYGHETGAMIAGVLVCLVIALTLCRNARALDVARAVALGTIAMGFGGTETYGQTIGLTQNAEMIGNWSAFYWGMLGLAIKGSVWIGFCGLFLGMGLSGTRYTAVELFVVMLLSLVAYVIGVWLLNAPFDLEAKRLPALYFSATWDLYPNQADPEPRYEAWGGIWFAFLFVLLYTRVRRNDGLGWRLGLWGVLGGALGFPLGQCIQAYHAWNAESMTEGIWPILNYWNFMETTFGLVMGAMLGLGAWLHRSRMRLLAYEHDAWMTLPWEWALLLIHCALLILSEFWIPIEIIGVVYDLGLVMGVIPLMAIAGGRLWPYFAIFPVTLMPIAGKTLLNLGYEESAISIAGGWFLYIIIPMALAFAAVAWYGREANRKRNAPWFTSGALLFCGWVYFLLNYAYFRFPWPWEKWTARTPNAIVFMVCIAAITWLAWYARNGSKRASAEVWRNT